MGERESRNIKVHSYLRDKAGKTEVVSEHSKIVHCKPELNYFTKERIRRGCAKTLFCECFDEEKIKPFEHHIPQVYEEIEKLTNKRIKSFPDLVQCLTEEEIEEYSKIGGGHGLYQYPDTVKINPNMDSEMIFLNFIHENIHHAMPQAEEKVVDILTLFIACKFNIGDKHTCKTLEEAY